MIWIVERSTSLPDSLRVLAYPTSCFILDGVLLAGRGLHIDEPEDQMYVREQQPARVIVRHSTLVPGWLLLPETEPVKSEGASIELNNVMTSLLIQRSIVGGKAASKCDLCIGEEIPICVAHCPNEALVFVEETEGEEKV